ARGRTDRVARFRGQGARGRPPAGRAFDAQPPAAGSLPRRHRGAASGAGRHGAHRSRQCGDGYSPRGTTASRPIDSQPAGRAGRVDKGGARRHNRGKRSSPAERKPIGRPEPFVTRRGSLVTSDAGLLAYRELDDVLGLTEMAGDVLADGRSGKNGRHALAGLFRQSVFGRLAGYEDVNDAERLRHDPAMRWIVGGKAAQRSAASPSQMGRFETQWLAAPKNFAALADLSGQWIGLVHGR